VFSASRTDISVACGFGFLLGWNDHKPPLHSLPVHFKMLLDKIFGALLYYHRITAISDGIIKNGMEGSSHGLICGTIAEFEGTEEHHKNMTWPKF
jgi:hypothetical protein